MKKTSPASVLPHLRLSQADHERLRLLVDTVIKSQPKLRDTLEPLRIELGRADILPPGTIPGTVVVMGSRVEIEDLEDHTVDAYTLVYPEQADAAAGRLSILAPIGTAILGFKQGDTFTWKTPGGDRRLLLRKVTPPVA